MKNDSQNNQNNHNNQREQNTQPNKPGGKLGTFAGVFTPSILTILGIILFLRLGYVTGSAGFGRALVILAVANLITIITSQSLAAIATNLRVKGGGDYYLISRTLGYKFGGAIGIVLYLAQSVSVAFYCIGFAEALSAILPSGGIDARLIAVIAVGALFLLAWMGADWATRFQYIVMLLLVASLASFFMGGINKWEYQTFIGNWAAPDGSPPFWIIFALFFPAVTGFTQGVSMSGDLKSPAKSLPLGTFLAVGVSIIVYLAVMIVFAGALPNEMLMQDLQSINKVSRFGFLIDAGVIAATLSSAMASFMGGPRILQSLAADRIFPILLPFSKGAGPNDNPRRAVMLTGCIALGVISIGQLDLIARVVSMFFLISYGLLNYATYYEADTGSPSFRPRFRLFNKYISLLGGLICLVILLALDIQYGVVALLIMMGIYLYLKHRAMPSRWADSSRSHALQVIRQQLIRMSRSPGHQRDWRPILLAFTKSPERRPPLLLMGDWIGGQSGFLTVVRILEGRRASLLKLKKEVDEEHHRVLRQYGIEGFSHVVQTEDVVDGLPALLQSFGIGPLRANTVMANWYGDSQRRLPGLQALKYGHTLRKIHRHGYNLCVLHADASKWDSLMKRAGHKLQIDVWWRGDNNSRLMLLFAYLMTRHKFWSQAEIRVLTAGSDEGFIETLESLKQLLDDVRIVAETQLVTEISSEKMVEWSSDSDVVFLSFSFQNSRLMDMNGYSLERTLPQLPPTLLAMAAQEVDLDAEPEEGAAGELAVAMDKLRKVEKRASKAQGKEKESTKRLEVLKKQEKESKLLSGDEPEKSKELLQAEAEAEKAFRKTAREKAKLEDALQSVIALGGYVEEESEL